MIDRLLESHDLRKINIDDKGKKALQEVFANQEEYIEIIDDKVSVLGIKPPNSTEIIHTRCPQSTAYLRFLRDEIFKLDELFNSRYRSNKQFLGCVSETIFGDYILSKLGEINVKSSVFKNKLNLLREKFKKISKRLQGVFISNEDMKEIINGFDSRKSIFVTKLKKQFDEQSLQWVKDVKKASIVVFCHDCKTTFDFLKSNHFDKMKIGRSKNKNIWIRNSL